MSDDGCQAIVRGRDYDGVMRDFGVCTARVVGTLSWVEHDPQSGAQRVERDSIELCEEHRAEMIADVPSYVSDVVWQARSIVPAETHRVATISGVGVEYVISTSDSLSFDVHALSGPACQRIASLVTFHLAMSIVSERVERELIEAHAVEPCGIRTCERGTFGCSVEHIDSDSSCETF